MHKHTYNKIFGIRLVYRIDIGEKKRKKKIEQVHYSNEQQHLMTVLIAKSYFKPDSIWNIGMNFVVSCALKRQCLCGKTELLVQPLL